MVNEEALVEVKLLFKKTVLSLFTKDPSPGDRLVGVAVVIILVL